MLKWIRFRELRFSSITFTLFVAMFLGPLLDRFAAADTLLAIFTTIVMLNAVYTMSDHPRLVWVAVVLTLVGVGSRWLGVADGPQTYAASFGLFADEAVLILTTVLILKRVLRARRVTSEVIYGSIGAYMLMGFAWALAYGWLAGHDPNAFSIGQPPTAEEFGPWMYYSFVTLTTLGYGDITPKTAAAQSLSSAEALVGQLFLAVLVARLVGLHVAQNQERESDEPPV